MLQFIADNVLSIQIVTAAAVVLLLQSSQLMLNLHDSKMICIMMLVCVNSVA